jgi:hypothetical protein
MLARANPGQTSTAPSVPPSATALRRDLEVQPATAATIARTTTLDLVVIGPIPYQTRPGTDPSGSCAVESAPWRISTPPIEATRPLDAVVSMQVAMGWQPP